MRKTWFLNRFTAILFLVLWGFGATVSAAVTYCAPSAFGYSTATGGGSATPVLVSSVSQLQNALNKGKNKVIIITQDLTFTTCMKVQDGSNVTLMGLPGVTLTSLQQDKTNSGILYVKRFNNLIIRNLTFVGPGAYDCDGWDLLCFENVTNAWVDHCDFQDGCDGNFDNKAGTDNVTVSWCRFRYLKAPKSGGSGGTADHRFTNLLGSSSSDAPSDGTYNFTWAYCWWDNGCKERMIRCRNAELHFLNCYWNSSVASYYVGPENAKAYFEGCTFEGKANTKDKIFKSYGGTNACKFVDCSGNLPSNSGTVSKPSYSYTASGRAEAKTAITNATCGAGATLTVTTAGAVSSSCDGGAPLPTVYTVTWDAATNSGSCGTTSTQVTDGVAIGTLPEATKEGYNFDGWYTLPSGGTKINSTTTVTGNVTYYAQFTSAPVTVYYTVIWDANGGTCGTASSTIESGQAVGTLPDATKAGDYTFDGWYTAINGGTKILTTTTVSSNVTYYAHYTATGGGGGGDCSITLTHFGRQIRTSAPRRGFAYVGSTSGTKYIIESNSSDVKNIDNDSSAIRLPYSNKFLKVLGPGATTDIEDSLFTGVTQISFKWKYAGSTSNYTTDLDVLVGGVKVATKTLTGNKNDDYATATISSIASKNGAVKIINKGSSSSNQKFDIDDIAITYTCSGSTPPPASYTLSYDENGGKGEPMEDQVGTSLTVAANTYTLTGYAFQKWSTSRNGGGVDYAAGDPITLTEDVTLYAIWQAQSYTVTFDKQSGDGGSASVTATFDESMPDITVPSRAGYIFKGYYSEVDGGGTQYYDENGSSTNAWNQAAATTLYAYWEAGSITPVSSDLHFWFFKAADATANGKTNDATMFADMVSDASNMAGSITIDGTSYSVTRRTGDHATFGSFTIPSGKTGVFYALAVSSGGGDRQINLVGATQTYELDVPGGSDSYKRLESEELPAGTYSIERDGTSNVRLSVVIVKLITALPPSAAPTISDQPDGATYCAGDAVSALSVTATGSGTVTYQWKKDGAAIPSAEAYTYMPTESGTYLCVVTNTEEGKAPNSLNSLEAVVTINGAIAAPTMSQTENTVNITTATAGATIYYTTDGTDPTTSSASGTSVTISESCTVKAYAVKDGCASTVTSFVATYDADVCTEPATLTNEIARFFVPCDVDRTQAYNVTDEPYGTTNTFTTSSFGGTGTNWYYNETTKLSYGKMNSSTGLTITIKLNTGNFLAGDVVYVYGNRNNTSKGGVKLHSSSGNTISLASTASGVEAEGTYILTAGDIESDGSLKFFRENSNSYINRIIITRPVSYSITYDCDGAESGCPSNVDVAYSLPDPLPDAPVKSGFDFEGWYTNAGKTDAAVAGAPLTDDITLYAKWVAARPTPTFTWTYADPMSAGGRYPISVSSTGDADVTLSIVSAVGGVALSQTTGNPATGTISLSSSPAATTFTVRASSAATATYKAHSEDKLITITICETAYNLAYGVGYIDAGSSSHPRYYHETTGVGRLTKSTGGSSYLVSDASWTGEAWITKSNKDGSHLLQTYIPNVHKIVLYGMAGSNSTVISKLRISDSYISSDTQGEDGLVGATIVYNNDPEQASMTKNVQETVTITLATPLSENDFVYVVFSSSTTLYGVKLYRPEGSVPTSVAYSVSEDVNKFAGDPNFTNVATQTTAGIPSNGVITYASSEEMVATVDAHTGEVTIQGVGRARITATLNVCGCFAASEAAYNLIVKPCTDSECTIAVTSGVAKKCTGASVTLTATADAGASFQWYKDDVLMVGETNATLTTTEPGAYYATARKVCLQTSNTITVANLEAPTAEALHEYYYVKSGRVTPDIPLFRVTNTTNYTMSHPAPSGCAYELREDDIIYLTGVPAKGLSAANYTLTVTAENPCGGASANASMTFYMLAETTKPTVAWIGCNGDGKNQQALPGSLAASQSTSHPLYTYLQDDFILTPVNAYCTIDTKKISDYYSQFDVVLLTDYPDSHICPTGDINPETGEKYKKTDANSYSNAIGSLIDQKPILTFEAFVAGLPNWGINTKPGPTSPTEKEITLLCSAHNIFEHTIPIDEKIQFVQSTSSSGLQGFAGLEAPSGMIFIATISDGSDGTRVVCCERQTVVKARMMILGLNHNAMQDVTEDGKIIIKQIIQYLLRTVNIADCAMVFDNQAGDKKWSNPGNWAPNHNVVPLPFQAVRIEQDCNVDVTNAHCSSIRLVKGTIGTDVYDAHLTISPSGGLTVTDYIKEVHGDNYMTTYPISSSDLRIQSSSEGNGALVFGNESEDLEATVEFYSKASGADTDSPVWQYMGIPVADRPMAINAYYQSWMCSWENVGNVSSNWRWVENEDRITPFKGYCITQNSAKVFIHTGTLNSPDTLSLAIQYFNSPDGEGFNMFANSWVAPIDITKMEVADFGAAAEPTIFIYNAGSHADYDGGGEPSSAGTNAGAGQYNAIPVEAVSFMEGSLTKIPSMQGFFIKASKNGTLTLNYDALCFNTSTYETTTEPTRAPKRMAESEDIVPEVMRLDVNGAHWSDRLYILTHPEFSGAFNLGWDGTKQEGDAEAPMLALPDDAGLLAVAAIESAEEHELLFRAGEDSAYTFRFDYSGETIYLYDRLTEQATEIRTGNTYSFVARNNTAMPRFLITKNPPRTPTAVENTTYSVQNTEARKMIIDGVLYILRDNRFYDARGVRVADQTRKEGAL